MLKGLCRTTVLIAAGLAITAAPASGGAWTEIGQLSGTVADLDVTPKGETTVVFSRQGGLALAIRPPGGGFEITDLSGGYTVPPGVDHANNGEALMAYYKLVGRESASMTMTRSTAGQVELTPHPELGGVRAGLREDGLGVLLGEQGGKAVVAWKHPGETRFGEYQPVPGLDLEEGWRSVNESAVNFVAGRAYLAIRQGDQMQIRSAAPYGTFGSPTVVGPANVHGHPPRLESRGGNAVVSWTTSTVMASEFFASVKSPGGDFAPATKLGQTWARAAPLAVVGANGHVMAAWNGMAVDPTVEAVFESQRISERRPGATAFSTLPVPLELAGVGSGPQFDSTGTAVFSGRTPMAIGAPAAPGFWTWSRSQDGTLAGPDQVTPRWVGHTFVLDGRGGGAAAAHVPASTRFVIYSYNEGASAGRQPPVVSALKTATTPAKTARASARRRSGVTALTMRLTKSARVRLSVEQLGKRGRVRYRCPKRKPRSRICFRQHKVSSWRNVTVGTNRLALSRYTRRLLRRPGAYRITAHAMDSRGRRGRIRTLRIRIRR